MTAEYVSMAKKLDDISSMEDLKQFLLIVVKHLDVLSGKAVKTERIREGLLALDSLCLKKAQDLITAIEAVRLD